MQAVRKQMKGKGSRVAGRWLRISPWDGDAPFILEALAVADDLIGRYPQDSSRIETLREMLRELLEYR
jgi:hypothetical protein